MLWVPFRSRAGFDYVVCHDEKGEIWWFDAAWPGERKKVMLDPVADVLAISCDWRTECFVVARRQQVLAVPMNE
jgi:hypothetical protein